MQKWDENIKDARRNSEQIRRIQTFWGPLFDHFPDSNNFPQIGQIGPIPQTVQIWPSGQASGLESQTPGVPGSIPGVCSNLGVSGAAQRLFPEENRLLPKWNRGTLDFDDVVIILMFFFIMIFDVCLMILGARFDSWCVFKSRCFWGGAKAFFRRKNKPFPK